MNNHYIYVWKEQGICGSGLPFYIGQGTHSKRNNYEKLYQRAYEVHKSSKNGLSYCQLKANKLARNGVPHIVEILYDNLTQDEANILEITLIKRLGKKIDKTGILYNICDGGYINIFESEYVRKKQKECCNTPEALENKSKAMKKVLEDPAKYEKRKEQLLKAIKKTKVIHNGTEYESIKECEKALEIPEGTGRNRLLKGFPIDYVAHQIEYNGKKTTIKELSVKYNLTTFNIKKRIELNIPLEKDFNRYFEYNGETLSLKELSRKYNLTGKQIVRRLSRGYSLETPIGKLNRRKSGKNIEIDGIIYESKSQAARTLGIDRSTFERNFRNGMYNV